MGLDQSPQLPIDARLDEVRAAAQAGRPLVIKAEPGAGKTTRVPPALMDALPGRVIVLEPRRLAARLSAERVAAERGDEVGRSVGYQIRLQSRVTRDTKLVFVTEGVFLRLVLDDPKLHGVSAVVIDEFHERHVHTDLALAIVRKLQQSARPDLRLVVMSATLDTAALENFLPGSASLVVEGRTFPVALEYLPFAEQVPVEERVLQGATRMIADPRCRGDVLVFLTGIQEIRRTAERLAQAAALRDCQILPLSAEVPPAEQARVFARSAQRKMILSTNVAETSLTIPGVTGVLDTGLAKIAGHASWSGMPTLDVKRVSQASCIQRTGRAGRTEAGVCYRLFAESDYLGRPAFTLPDVQRLDFTETYLEVLSLSAALGDDARDIKTALPWFELPEERSVESARRVLTLLGAVDADGRLTPFGKKMAEIPLHPRLAAIVVRGVERALGGWALLAACLVSEKMLLARSAPALTRGDCDVRFQLELFVRAQRRELGRAEKEAIDPGKLQQIDRLFEQLGKRLGIETKLRGDVPPMGACLLAGFPDRVAQLRRIPQASQQGRTPQQLFNLAMGRGGVLSETSAAKGQELILALDASESLHGKTADRGTTIFVAGAVSEAELLDDPADLLRQAVEAVWVDSAERVDVMSRLWYGQLLLREERLPLTEQHQSQVEELLRTKLAERWPKPFDDGSDLSSYHERLRLLEKQGLEGDYLRFEGEMLELLLASICAGKRSFAEIASKQLVDYIEDQLSYEARTRLDKLLPARVSLSNGKKLPISYEPDRPPYVAGFIQDFYGEKTTPAIVDGRMPLSVHLLAPNKRPIQVTSDLAGFWKQAYPEIKRELSRNYPKHHWADDPATAPPILHKAKLRPERG